MKIAFFFTHSLSNISGGGETALCELLSKINTDKFSVTLIVEHPFIHDFYRQRINKNIKIISIYNYLVGKYIKTQSGQLKWKAHAPRFIFKLFAKFCYVKKLTKFVNYFDVIVDMDPYATIKNILRYKINHQSKIIAWHHMDFQRLKIETNIQVGKEPRNILPLVNGIFFVNPTIANEAKPYLVNLNPKLMDKVYVIPNGVDLEYIQQLSDQLSAKLTKHDMDLLDSKYILMVARQDKIKGYDVLLNAFATVCHEIPDYNLICLGGEGNATSELSQLLWELNLSERVFFIGARENPYLWMKNCQFAVLSSRSEAFGLVLLETLIFGKPIIVSDLQPIRDVFNDALIYFELGNSGELAKKLLMVAQHSYQINTTSASTRGNILKTYSVINTVREFERAAVSLLGCE